MGISLAQPRIMLAGAGSGGGVLAFSLAAARYRRITIVDRDVLEPDNAPRHLCGRQAAGVPKAIALAQWLEDHFEGMELETHTFDLVENPERWVSHLAGIALVLSAVDNESAKHWIDLTSRSHGLCAVYGGVYARRPGGEVIRIAPAPGSPCYACAASMLGRGGVPLHLEPSPAYTRARTRTSPDRSDPSAASGPLPLSWLELAPVALLHAQVAIRTLQGDSSPALWQIRPAASGWRVSRRRISRDPACLCASTLSQAGRFTELKPCGTECI